MPFVNNAPGTEPSQPVMDQWLEQLCNFIKSTGRWFDVNLTTGKVTQKCPTSLTVGAAGTAAALPATPLGYEVRNVNGVEVKFPYYASD